MGPFLAILAAAMPALAAFSLSDIEYRHQTMSAVGKEVNQIDHELPPCEAQRRMAEILRLHEAPASCPRAYAYLRLVQEAQGKLIQGCEEYNRYIVQVLKGPSACRFSREQGSRELKDALQDQRSAYEEVIGKIDGQKAVPEEELIRFEEGNAPGEYGRAECSVPITIARQAIRRQASWQARHVRYAERALDHACSGSASARSEYEAFLRGGEAAVDELATTQP